MLITFAKSLGGHGFNHHRVLFTIVGARMSIRPLGQPYEPDSPALGLAYERAGWLVLIRFRLTSA
jgi:hypothetical protein